jgi:hypothetical protein
MDKFKQAMSRLNVYALAIIILGIALAWVVFAIGNI